MISRAVWGGLEGEEILGVSVFTGIYYCVNMLSFVLVSSCFYTIQLVILSERFLRC